MDQQTQESSQEQVTASENISPIKKKKKKKGLIIFLVVLLIAAAARRKAVTLWKRQKPVSTVKSFLEHVRTMNFEGMKSLLQSNDMSALDNADITNEAYHAFFQGVNQKMTYEIKKSRFQPCQWKLPLSQQKFKYIDGSDIYKEIHYRIF